MIKEEYVQFETAKLLKDAGFPQDGLYACNTKSYIDDILNTMYVKPTQAQAMRWLREDMGMIVTPRYNWDGAWWYTFEGERYGFYKSYDFDKNDHLVTYEAAAEEGIKAACEYLIEKTNYNAENRTD